MRQLNSASLDLIKQFESLQLKPYLCPAGVPTIGYGTTVYPDGHKVSIVDPGITEDQALSFLQHDVKRFAQAVQDSVAVVLNDNQFGALVSLIYNIGITAFKTSTLLKTLNVNNLTDAADQFLVWVYGGGQKLPGLVKRRKAERLLFLLPESS